MPKRPLSAVIACVAIGLAACATPVWDARDEARASLVEAERAFARHAGTHGVRAAFLAHFAADGLMFVPGPRPVTEVFAEAPADPMATLLEWEPVASGVAQSGDFGFTTGPSRMSRRDGSRPPRHGTFFSVWKRTGAGPWRVALDAGTSTPAAVAAERLLPSPAVPPVARGHGTGLDALLADERSARWTRAGFLARLAPDAILQREGHLPLRGADAIAASWPEGDEALMPLGGDVASSRDLAYTFGSTTSAAGAGRYVHLWARDAAGTAWRIAVAIRLP